MDPPVDIVLALSPGAASVWHCSVHRAVRAVLCAFYGCGIPSCATVSHICWFADVLQHCWRELDGVGCGVLLMRSQQLQLSYLACGVLCTACFPQTRLPALCWCRFATAELGCLVHVFCCKNLQLMDCRQAVPAGSQWVPIRPSAAEHCNSLRADSLRLHKLCPPTCNSKLPPRTHMSAWGAWLLVCFNRSTMQSFIGVLPLQCSQHTGQI